MDISKLSGVVPPVVTPLNEDKKFDKKSFEKVINRLIDAGVDGLFILGSTGSVVFLTKDERDEVICAADEIISGRTPLLVGCIDTQTNRVIEHIKVCEKYNVDAVVATAPFYALDCQENIERHFRKLHEATDLPIFAYDLPVCVHKKLDHNLLVKLGCEGVLAGVKDSSGDDVGFRYLCMENEKQGHPLRIFTGHEVVAEVFLFTKIYPTLMGWLHGVLTPADSMTIWAFAFSLPVSFFFMLRYRWKFQFVKERLRNLFNKSAMNLRNEAIQCVQKLVAKYK